MKKSVIILSASIAIISCNNGKNEKTEITKEINQKSEIVDISFSKNEDNTKVNLLFEKISNKKSLNIEEYSSLSTYIFKNKDESISENIGYLLFQYFQNNNKLSKEFVSFLKTKTDDYKEMLLSVMIQLMCIDLSEENYTYEKLITDFRFFDKEVIAKKIFDECINNVVRTGR